MDIKKNYLIILLLLVGFALSSQNLVRDGGFENYKKCPQGVTHQISELQLRYWYIPTKGTTDYFNKCSKKGVSIPSNQVGYQDTHSGNGYAGFLSAKLGNEREYIQSELIQPLINGEEYYVEFWVSLADYSIYGISKLGAYFSNSIIREDFIKPLKVNPQIVMNEPILDTMSWVKVSGIFKAQGGEKYITIGSFSSSSKCLVKTGRKIFPKEKSAYYYLDDVLVEPVKKDTIITKQYTSELNKPIILKNITFEFGKSQLKESSFAELNTLAAELNANPSYQISLSGHTDNIGQEEDNLELSQARAKAVAEYLTSKGIAPTRITYKGYGSQQPISTNDTEQGREQNRRVEFILSQDEK